LKMYLYEKKPGLNTRKYPWGDEWLEPHEIEERADTPWTTIKGVMRKFDMSPAEAMKWITDKNERKNATA